MGYDPTVTVEIAFTSDLTTSSWTDVSGYVRSVSVTRGRNSELERFGPGRCTILLDNRDRRFDPLQGIYTHLGPMNRVRVRATHNSTTFDVFNGFVDGWPQAYDVSNREATVSLTATDAFGYLANTKVPDAWEATIKAPGTLAVWYPLNETSGTEEITDAVTGDTGTAGGVQFGQDPIGVAPGNSGFFSGAATVSLSNRMVDTMIADSSWTLGFLYRCATAPVGGSTATMVLIDSGSFKLRLGLFWNTVSFGLQQVRTISPASLWANLQSGSTVLQLRQFDTTNMADGQNHFVALTKSGSTYTLYLDGTSLASGSFTPSLTARNKVQVGGTNGTGTVPLNGWMSDVMLWTSVLSGSELTAVSDAVTTGWDGDSAAERMTRLLDTAGWPGDTSLEAGDPRCCHIKGSGTALSMLQTVDATEQGRFFVAKDGTLTLHTRTHNITDASSTSTQATFSDTAV